MKAPIRRALLFLLGIGILAGIGYGALMLIQGNEEEGTANLNYTLVRPQTGDINATIDASGSIQASAIVNANYRVNGIVTNIFVTVGDSVEQGTPLAQLDTQEYQLSVEKAKASLAQATASYEQLRAEPTDAEIEQAEAQVRQTEAQLQQAQGEVTAEDIASANAQLEQAQVALAQLESGPKEVDVQMAQSRLDSARATLENQRTRLSAAKTNAHLQMEQAANALRDQQTNYSRVYWDNRNLERDWDSVNLDLPQSRKDQEESILRSVKNAETNLEQAQIAYDEARQAEITGIQSAEAEVANAQANLDKLLAGADSDDIAAARSQVVQAEARLAKLVGQQNSGRVDSAQANVDQAQSRLEALTLPPREVDLAGAQAQIQGAEVSLKEAELNLEKTTLKSPISGVVSEINLKIGERETPSNGRPAFIVADISRFYVYTNIDEIDVAQIAIGQPVMLTLDALPELSLEGTIDTISPLSNEESVVASYVVRIQTSSPDKRIRSGMSVNADIIVKEKNNVLLVPRRAVYAERDKRFVDILTSSELCDSDQTELPPETEITVDVVDVETGLSNDQVIEIVSNNITEDMCIYVEGVDARLNPLAGPPPGARERRRRD